MSKNIHKKTVKKPLKKVAPKSIAKISRSTKLNILPAKHLLKFKKITKRIKDKRRNFLARRPHRSFRLTRRRDYVRSLKIPGYTVFIISVNKMFRKNIKTFIGLIVIYAVIMVILGAITSQDTYTVINGMLRSASDDFFGKGIGQVGQAGLIALTAFASTGSGLSPDNNVFLMLGLMLAWLSTVWLLREILLGRKPKLRDGLYNSGAPLLSFVGVLIVGLIQMLPVGIIVLAYSALSAINMLDGGLGNMIFWLIGATSVILSLYWLTSTIIAMVVVTLPGMYPMRAVQIAGDLVVGRRLRILFRLLFGLIIGLVTWALVIIIFILLDNWLKMAIPTLEKLPIVPYVGALASSCLVVWYATYVYLFYRKVVDDNAKPA